MSDLAFYDYKCLVCEETIEVRHSIKKEPVITCPVCGCVMVRQISGGGFIDFKGNGFYCTDYPKKKKK